MNICYIVPGKIFGDSRVIKTIRTLSKIGCVHVFYVSDSDRDQTLFENNVILNVIQKNNSKLNYFLKHSFFYYQYNYMINEILKLSINFDYVWVNDLPVLNVGLCLKKKLNSKLIYDSHEIYTETINQFFPKKANGVKKLIFSSLINFMRRNGKRFEKNAVKKIDFFITVCDSLKEYFEKSYHVANIRIVMNCPYFTPQVEAYEKINLKEYFGFKDNVFLLLFQGNLGPGKDIDMIIKAIEYTDNEICLGILGDGPLKQEFQCLVEEMNLGNRIKFKDRVSALTLHKFTASADGGITLKNNNINLNKKLGIATKFFEYTHAGIPIISTNSIEIERISKKYGYATLVERSHQEIVDAINNLKNIDRIENYHRCRKAAEEYNWENQEKIIQKIFTPQPVIKKK